MRILRALEGKTVRMHWVRGFGIAVAASCLAAASLLAQLPDRTVTPNAANEGIAKSYEQQVGAGREAHGRINLGALFNNPSDPE